MKIKYHENSEVFINVAPLVEVMLVLIIIFMLTAPTLNVGIQVDLPKSGSTEINNSKNPPVIISINKLGELFLEETKMSIEELTDKLPHILQAGKTDVVYIRGDKNLPYGKIVEIMSFISMSGLCKVSLIAEHDETLNVKNSEKVTRLPKLS